MSEDRENRNQNIFGGPPGAHQGIQRRDVMKEDFNYEVPVETVPLPSLGLTYPADDPLHGRDSIMVKAMTAKEEDILTSRALIKKGTVISALLKSCLIDKNINVEKMLSGDRNALMVALRVTGYGSGYTAEVDCPACGERSKQTFSLTELPINQLKLNPTIPGTNTFEYELPLTKKKVKFKFLTGEDEQELSTIAERKKKQGVRTENSVTTRLEYAITSIDGVTDRNKISMFVRNMPARDSLALRKYIDKHEPGIEMKSWMDCPSCFEHSEVRLPLGAAFFWPDTE